MKYPSITCFCVESHWAICFGEGGAERFPGNYWYSQAWLLLYQQQNETDKAVELLEQMSVRFSDKQEPLLNLLDLYGRQQKYDRMISTLDRLEKRMGKNEQLSMEVSPFIFR